jgi:hypothetical protein
MMAFFLKTRNNLPDFWYFHNPIISGKPAYSFTDLQLLFMTVCSFEDLGYMRNPSNQAILQVNSFSPSYIFLIPAPIQNISLILLKAAE